MSFNEFIHDYEMKNEATSIIKNNRVLKRLGLDSKVRVFLRDRNYSTNSGIFNLHHSKGAHSVCHKGVSYFDSFGNPRKKFQIK